MDCLDDLCFYGSVGGADGGKRLLELAVEKYYRVEYNTRYQFCAENIYIFKED